MVLGLVELSLLSETATILPRWRTGGELIFEREIELWIVGIHL